MKKLLALSLALLILCFACAAIAEATDDGYVFEAEYTDLTMIFGHGYSNEVEGVGTIVKDTYEAGASNGYFVGYLYEQDNALEFHITADRDITDATLLLRASMEYQETVLTWQDFTITVNDGDPIQYRDLRLSGSGIFSMGGGLVPFKNYTIGKIDLNEGANVIRLTVNNSSLLVGTMRATAPVVDAIIIRVPGDEVLTWNEEEGYPLTDNIR